MEDHAHTSPAGVDGAATVSLTERALEQVKAARQREALGADYALRLGIVGGGCSGFSYSMGFDNQRRPDDTVVAIDGIDVLIDAASIEYLQGTTLDYVSGLHGAGFKFDNPRAQRTCGCGSSFSV